MSAARVTLVSATIDTVASKNFFIISTPVARGIPEVLLATLFFAARRLIGGRAHFSHGVCGVSATFNRCATAGVQSVGIEAVSVPLIPAKAGIQCFWHWVPIASRL